MITLKKIKSLKPRVRVRKLGQIFHLATYSTLEKDYVDGAYRALLEEELLSDEDKRLIESFYRKGEKEDLDDIYYRTLTILGESPADWDVRDDSGNIKWDERTIFDHYLYLDHLRSPYNVGSIFRSSEAFGVKKIFLSPGSASPLHERAKRTSRGTVDALSWETEELENIDMPIFALETGGVDISSFAFPKRGICIIGSEEEGVSREALKRAQYSLGRVSIKQFGVKGSINVASAVAILLHYWSKEGIENE